MGKAEGRGGEMGRGEGGGGYIRTHTEFIFMQEEKIWEID